MPTLRFTVTILLNLLTVSLIPIQAKTFTFDDLNFQCTTPEGWNCDHKIGDVVHAFNPSRTKFFCLSVYKYDMTRKSMDEMEHAMVVQLENQGYTDHSPRAPFIVHGVSFDTYTFAQPSGSQVYHLDEYVGYSNGFIYQFELAMYDGTPSADPELKSIVASFDFLKKIQPRADPVFSSPTQGGKVD